MLIDEGEVGFEVVTVHVEEMCLKRYFKGIDQHSLNYHFR